MEQPLSEGLPCWEACKALCTVEECPHHIIFTKSHNCSLRLDRGLTQAETGRALKLSRQHISQIEKGALRKLRAHLNQEGISEYPLGDGAREPVLHLNFGQIETAIMVATAT
jgi:hypothetical protein